MHRLPNWIRQHLAAVRALLALTVVTGLLYPLTITLIAQVFFTGRANGSIVRDGNGRDVGSALIGQPFTDAALRGQENVNRKRFDAAVRTRHAGNADE